DADYPANLREISTPPERLYVRGTMTDGDALAVAIVGSRTATSYGLAVAERLAAELAGRGITVVSGLARGIDSAAHRGALPPRRPWRGRPPPRRPRLGRGRDLSARESSARARDRRARRGHLPVRARPPPARRALPRAQSRDRRAVPRHGGGGGGGAQRLAHHGG